MANCVYIIYSKALDKYYVGETEDFELRLQRHNTGFYKNTYTAKTRDWIEYMKMDCPDKTTAIKLEQFIKRMKSRKFIERLKCDPQMQQDILCLVLK